uniref:7TM_GPCR_Srx domain-containing protein n=1 Tax=Heterorhabditis bacteriophora TaxID=37862 RepID=A0A1I7XS27_HETBA
MPCVLRWFSINSKETINDSRAREERQEKGVVHLSRVSFLLFKFHFFKAKVRRAYAIGGCVFFMWISTHGIFQYCCLNRPKIYIF